MTVFKIAGRNGKKSNCWYGKVKDCGGWKRVKLFTDKKASVTRLSDLQRVTDQRASGMITADAERLSLPIAELAKQYVDSLRIQHTDAEHIRISEWMLNRMIKVGQWKRFQDITPSVVESMLPKLAKTASYQNKFIVRAKAFIHWSLPEGWIDPLKKLKRVKEKGAKKTRERRAGSDAEVRALFSIKMPEDRKLAYALAAFNGLRRNEVNGLLGGDLQLDVPIPFVGLRQKQAQNDSRDYIPLHPYVLKLLRGRDLVAEKKLLSSVPDIKTMKRDLDRAGVKLTDVQGRRLDYHALRHTFQTGLDRTGCSRATKKRLMRHAHEDVTDGYAHAELAEMSSALNRLVSTELEVQNCPRGINAGVVGGMSDSEMSDHQLDQATTAYGRSLTPMNIQAVLDPLACSTLDFCYNLAAGMDLQSPALIGIHDVAQAVYTYEFRPSTQVD